MQSRTRKQFENSFIKKKKQTERENENRPDGGEEYSGGITTRCVRLERNGKKTCGKEEKKVKKEGASRAAREEWRTPVFIFYTGAEPNIPRWQTI